jgi:DNA polymerase III subunit alpha
MGFVHLHNHTQYSALDGACRIDKMVDLAKQYEMPALAMTDHGTMSGTIEFYLTATKNSIKPIIGIEAYVINGEIDDPYAKASYRHHLILLVQNAVGYKNLIKLSSLSYIDGFYYKPRISKSLLAKHSEGIICMSACIKGEIPHLLLNGQREEAEKAVEFYRNTFPDRFYLELMMHDLSEEKSVMPEIIKLAEKTDTPLVVTNDCHYLKQKDHEAHDILLCIQTGKTFDDPNRMRYDTNQLYFKTEEEMRSLFPEQPQAYENTLKIAEEIDFKLDHKNFLLPKVDLPDDQKSEKEYLHQLCYQNARKKYPEMSDDIKDRIDYELGVISNMGFENYFLVVKDLVDASRKMNVPVGPGRGSAAGSIVSYLLGITQIDPISHNLLFERFLNPDRIEMPDIDIDFCAEGRNQIIDYVINKYGRFSVTQIITFNTLAAKSVIKDVARVLGVSAVDANKITKTMPGTPKITLEKCLEESSEFAQLMRGNELYESILNYSLVLEGLIRQHGIHAAGVVIGPDDLSNYVPLATSTQKGASNSILVQYEGKWLDYLKLLKMDILGLKTLSIIKKAVQLIKESQGIDVDIENVDLKDSKTYELFSQGYTDGIFQFESQGMKKHLRVLKPNLFSDIVAMVALYRPGPMQYIDTYIRRKYGKEEVIYDHPLTENALKETYGVTIYQEQVMQMSREMGGFTGGEADTLRKAMGKKNQEVMDKLKPKYVQGARANNVPEDIIEKTWNNWLEFAKYAFNKSHSVCYAYVAYQTAYLKSHYPVEFMAALLSLEKDPAKIPYFLEECRSMNLEVIPPNINRCAKEFTVQQDKILFGLRAIKNVGDVAIDNMLKERDQNGPFQDIFEFCSRIDQMAVNRAVLESLIYAGALDELEGNRAQKIDSLDCAIEYGNSEHSERKKGQPTLFSILESADEEEDNPGSIPNGCKPVLKEIPEWSLNDKLAKEKQILGFYVSGHPLFRYKFELAHFTNYDTRKFADKNQNIPSKIQIGGIATSVQHKKDAKNKNMCIVMLEDLYGRFELTLFERELKQFENIITEGVEYLVTGRVSSFNKNGFQQKQDQQLLRLVPQKIMLLSELPQQVSGEATLQLKEDEVTPELISLISRSAAANPGRFNLLFDVKTKLFGNLQIKPEKLTVYPGKKFRSELKEFIGKDLTLRLHCNEIN